MNFISREQVLAVLDRLGLKEARAEIEKLFSYPAPNPDNWLGGGDNNIMGQTEEQFWDAIEAEDK